MNRRDVLAGLTAAALAGCTERRVAVPGTSPGAVFQWKMVTTWPPGFPIFGVSAERLARAIEVATAGRIRIRVYAAGELVPAFEAFDAVSRGLAQVGHGPPAYWRGFGWRIFRLLWCPTEMIRAGRCW